MQPQNLESTKLVVCLSVIALVPCEVVSTHFETLQELSSSYQDIAESIFKVKIKTGNATITH